jgi:hypothetical protein
LKIPNINSDAPPAEGASNDNVGGVSDVDIESNCEEAIEAFDAMDLSEELLRGIYAYGFEKPSAIQQRAIKPTILGRDLIAQAQSGTVSIRSATIREYFMEGKKGVMILKKHHLSSLKRVVLYVSDKPQLEI